MTVPRPYLEWMPLFPAARACGYEMDAAFQFAKIDESTVEAGRLQRLTRDRMEKRVARAKVRALEPGKN
jgi:hypothetical protein